MRLVKLIRNRVAERLQKAGRRRLATRLSLAASSRNVAAAAALVTKFIRKADTARSGILNTGPRIRILGLEKVGFGPDMQMVCHGWDGTELFFLHRTAIKAMAAAFLPVEIDDNNYLGAGGTEGDAAKAAYRTFLAEVWPRVQQLAGGFQLVATGNFGYYAERELAAAIHECGTPFVVLQKENLKTPGLASFWEKVYRERRGPFGGTRIFTYNEIERRIEINAGVATEARVEVCGMPRLDRAHALRGSAGSPKPTVLFFDFSERVGLPSLARKDRSSGESSVTFEETFASGTDLRWTELWRQCRRALLELSRRNPSARIIIKTKVSKMEIASLRNFLSSYGRLPGNIEIVSGGDPLHLVKEAWVVAGFNSTALLEALAAGRPVVVPGFAEASLDSHQPFVLDLFGAADVPSSETRFIAAIERHIRSGEPQTTGNLLPDAATKALEHWCGNADGKASSRLRVAIERLTQGTN